MSGATDVFALGSVLAYAACGQPPFGDESGHGVLYRIVHEEPDLEPLRELEPNLAELVAACLDKDPEGRPTAAELLERARLHGPFAAPLWPGAVTERLTERAAFAANAPEADVPTVPLTGEHPEPEPEPESEPEKDPAPAIPAPPVTARPERTAPRRRTRVLLAVVPVVVVAGGTTLALQHLPSASAPRAGAGNSPSAPVTAPVDPTASTTAAGPAGTAGASPSGTASPAQPPAQDPGAAAAAGGAGGPGSGTGPGPLPGGGTQPGSSSAGNSDNPANGGGSGSMRPGGTGGAGGSGGTSTAPTTPPPPAPPASGTYRFRNGNNSQCITQVFGASDSGDCADASARWTVQSSPDGSFKLVNQQGGGCLYANMLGQAVFVGDCSQGTARLWRTGSGGSLRNDFSGGCLDLGMSSGLVTKTCGGEASQRWTKQG
ncbi:ricin-type beta-trefoil lectin domain protein [Streptomyces sp. NPDC091682]|uniref:protein kinase domain-containing protein n=1 Tax=Streptomyces sp. NPDC091682 TaxID=3366005 RepID=UPI00382EC464